MKRFGFASTAGLIVFTLLICGAGDGQGPDKKDPPKKGLKGFGKDKGFGKGVGGGGFERPLAAGPRRGNPGASPDLTDADFRDLIAHAKDFDANKDGKLSKDELPEMFVRFFDRADTDKDGFLSPDEMKRVLDAAPSKSTTAGPGKTSKGP